jgi:hypothetical protein
MNNWLVLMNIIYVETPKLGVSIALRTLGILF